MDLKDKVAIVTGSSSGIDLSTARLFSDKGAKVNKLYLRQRRISSCVLEEPRFKVVFLPTRDWLSKIRFE